MDDEDREAALKSRFAVPEWRLYGDTDVGHGQLVIMQPSRDLNDWTPSCGDSGTGGGDGD